MTSGAVERFVGGMRRADHAKRNGYQRPTMGRPKRGGDLYTDVMAHAAEYLVADTYGLVMPPDNRPDNGFDFELPGIAAGYRSCRLDVKWTDYDPPYLKAGLISKVLKADAYALGTGTDPEALEIRGFYVAAPTKAARLRLRTLLERFASRATAAQIANGKSRYRREGGAMRALIRRLLDALRHPGELPAQRIRRRYQEAERKRLWESL